MDHEASKRHGIYVAKYDQMISACTQVIAPHEPSGLELGPWAARRTCTRCSCRKNHSSPSNCVRALFTPMSRRPIGGLGVVWVGRVRVQDGVRVLRMGPTTDALKASMGGVRFPLFVVDSPVRGAAPHDSAKGPWGGAVCRKCTSLPVGRARSLSRPPA